MRLFILITLLSSCTYALQAQRACTTHEYGARLQQENPALQQSQRDIEAFTSQYIQQQQSNRNTTATVITIPVVVHLVYRTAAENISNEQVLSQIARLNEAYRKKNTDISRTPAHFMPYTADCAIEFCLAKVDPQGRATSGIVRKQTNVISWEDNDKVKYKSNGGADAWDADRYLNIWVCNLGRFLGYASLPGGPKERDGVVIHFTGFGTMGALAYPYNEGKTAVHEIGHWLNLKHLWGDTYCGDDGVYDTPTQRNFSTGCPTGMPVTCDNGPYGNMYMNYMDYTNDACMFMFTEGQKLRMRALFAAGGPRYALSLSKACIAIPGAPAALPDDTLAVEPERMRVFPNPATTFINIELNTGETTTAQPYALINQKGVVLLSGVLQQKVTRLDIAKIPAGIYFLRVGTGKEGITKKVVKL